MTGLQSTWKVNYGKDEPHSIIRVVNLHTSLDAVSDAWGRHPESQPVLISCTLHLRKPFALAIAEDAVTESTVHYGTLSKSILEACGRFSDAYINRTIMLSRLIHFIQRWLTGIDNLIDEPCFTIPSKYLLKSTPLELLTLDVVLPKASLLGSGIKMGGAFRYNESSSGVTMFSMMCEFSDLRIPTLIGVNSNERLAKQMLIVTVQIDYFNLHPENFSELEQTITKTVEQSSFQTLEALASHVVSSVVKFYLHFPERKKDVDGFIPKIRVKLSKPTAVTLADFPSVEMMIDFQE
ncbi:Folic acid synthesis protein fol1 [Erysiphe neolycopersici]|uniref:Folic acid synthesis protein fol1 n=1 Tax=Erysiphe neolycopersici TaxID=212602 RepID=A0A420I4L2_9PEZI|nr:Folic acid synthesis protein fol1 [Erysiphe neolycopersici]